LAVQVSEVSVVVARLRAAGCVFAEDEARLLMAQAATAADLATMVDRRVGGLPLEQVLGWAEFHGLRIAVAPGVFVPRRRTEFLVDRAVALARKTVARQRFVVVDLCCGTGAIGVAVAAALGDVELHAADVEPAAVRCARRNIALHGGTVYEGDLDTPLPASLAGRVDVLTANAPYVPTESIDLLPPEARLHEPLVALDGGGDGLDILRRVVAVAVRWLSPGGHVLVETSRAQAPVIAEALSRNGLRPEIATSDELDATVVSGLAG
jgi:release factor glutamine methyltransferase